MSLVWLLAGVSLIFFMLVICVALSTLGEDLEKGREYWEKIEREKRSGS